MDEGLLGATSCVLPAGTDVWMMVSKRSLNWSTSGVSGLGNEATEVGEKEDRPLLQSKGTELLLTALVCVDDAIKVSFLLKVAATSASCSSVAALEQVDG